MIFPLKRNFTAHISICQKFKGVVSVVKDRGTMSNLNEKIKLRQQCRNNIGIMPKREKVSIHYAIITGTLPQKTLTFRSLWKLLGWLVGQARGRNFF